MDRWRKTTLGAVVVLALVEIGGGASAATFQKGRITWSPASASSTFDGGVRTAGAIGAKYMAL